MTASAMFAMKERHAFERDGFLVIPDILSSDLVSELNDVADGIRAAEISRGAITKEEDLHLLGCISQHETLLNLAAYEPILEIITEILGWNIFMYHSHLDINPPMEADPRSPLDWHQDGGQINPDLCGQPAPRLSVKVGYFLSDVSEPDRGNFHVIPGSHLRQDSPPVCPDGRLCGIVPILARERSAIVFDRRLWHARGHNGSHVTRKVVFYGYAYRWMRPRDDMAIPEKWTNGKRDISTSCSGHMLMFKVLLCS